MLTIPIEELAYIISKAREHDVEVPPVDEESGSNPSDDLDRDVLEESPDNPTYQELVDAIDSLKDSERIELLALMWPGRGDYDKEELARGAGRSKKRARRKRNLSPRRHAASRRLSGGGFGPTGLFNRGLGDWPPVARRARLISPIEGGRTPTRSGCSRQRPDQPAKSAF